MALTAYSSSTTIGADAPLLPRGPLSPVSDTRPLYNPSFVRINCLCLFHTCVLRCFHEDINDINVCAHSFHVCCQVYLAYTNDIVAWEHACSDNHMMACVVSKTQNKEKFDLNKILRCLPRVRRLDSISTPVTPQHPSTCVDYPCLLCAYFLFLPQILRQPNLSKVKARFRSETWKILLKNRVKSC